MASESSEKTGTIEKFRLHESDTGSADVQIALLTKRLETLREHFNKHPGDKHSRRGLLGIVSKRGRLLKYLKRTDLPRYRSTIQTLGLRK